METRVGFRTKEIKAHKEEIEKKLNVVIAVQGKKVTIEGEALGEYEATNIIEAMLMGFSAREAMLLLDPLMIFRKFNIKDHTRRKDMKEVRGRIIGTEGKTKRTMEDVSGCFIEIDENVIGMIGPADNIENASTALINLIKGSKQSNIYSFLERMNTSSKDQIEGLGIKEEKAPVPKDKEAAKKKKEQKEKEEKSNL